MIRILSLKTLSIVRRLENITLVRRFIKRLTILVDFDATQPYGYDETLGEEPEPGTSFKGRGSAQYCPDAATKDHELNHFVCNCSVFSLLVRYIFILHDYVADS